MPRLDEDDLSILIAHWRNEEGQCLANDDEYAFHCRKKARLYEKALDYLEAKAQRADDGAKGSEW